jgi:hypothetical protein
MPRLSPVLLLPLLALSDPAGTGQLTHDSGRLIVRQRDAIIGQEEFSLDRVEGGAGEGTNLIVSAHYPPAVPNRVVASFGSRRITVRLASDGTEVAREYPGGSRTIVVADHALSLYCVSGALAAGPVTVVEPGASGRRAGTLEDRGQDHLPGVRGGPVRHMALTSGADVVDLWYDAAGRLLRIAIPGKDLTAERAFR